MTADARRFSPATTRNREPILSVLRRVIREGARVLEIASGSGEHALYFAEHLPVECWQPTDPSDDALASIDAWRQHAGSSRVLPARRLDVHMRPWPVAPAEALVCANMLHIAPWSACEALFEGAAAVLAAHGPLVLYGPYKKRGEHTAASNERFDADLRSRDSRWGVRDLEAVLEQAARHGFQLQDEVAMPANNLTLVLARGDALPTREV